MAESYSVKARLSAVDAGFTKAMEGASNAAKGLKTTLTGGLGFGIMAGIGHKACSIAMNGISGITSELESSSAAWKTYEGNMKIFGKSSKKIKSTKKELQKYAQETIYSASDMSSTYAQLTAVGIKGANTLVTGFGGIAAAAENPTQAMKTLSQQATQMAAKPTVAWQDFKLMLEQTPAGIAAVAKEMGMTTSELVTNIQNGTVATDDFFAAVDKVGNSKAFSDMARDYKNLGQAMDGLQETAANKLGPAFGVVQDAGIKAISSIIDKMGEIPADALADKVSGWIIQAKPYWESFKDVMVDVGGIIKKTGGFIAEHKDVIAKVLPYLIAGSVAYKGFKIINAVVPGMSLFTKAILGLAKGGLSGLAGKLFGVAGGETAAGNAAKVSNKSILTMAKSSMMLGAAVLMISGGFTLLAYSSIQLANAGTPAIACMVGMVGAIALLVAGAAALGPALTAGSNGFLAFGAAILMVSTGALLAAAALAVVASVLPTVCTYGTQGAVAITALGASLIVLATGATIAGASAVVLGAGLIALGAGATLAGAGMTLFGAGVVVASAGMVTMVASLAAVNSKMKSIGKNAKSVEKSMSSMRKSMDVVNTGLDALGSKAKSAMNSMISAFDNTANKAVASGKKLGTGYAQGISSGCTKAISVANSTSSGIVSALNRAQSGAYRSGVYIGVGLANGMASQLGRVRSIAAQLAAAAEKAIRAKAKIHSPSRVSGELGAFWAEGWINNIKAGVKKAHAVAEELVTIPKVKTPKLAFDGGPDLSGDYSYSRNETFNITVVSEIDGREVARSTAPYTRDEINKIDRQNRRKKGIR